MFRKVLGKMVSLTDRLLFGKPKRITALLNPYNNPEDRNPTVGGEWHMVDQFNRKMDDPKVRSNIPLKTAMIESSLKPARKRAMIAEAAEAWENLLSAIRSHKKHRVREALPKALYYTKTVALYEGVPIEPKQLRRIVTYIEEYYKVDCSFFMLGI